MGRLALVLALALMAAQAISFVLLARAQDRFAAERAAYTALLPITAALTADEAADLGERPPRGRARFASRRVRVAGAPPTGERLAAVEAAAARALAARDIDASAVRVVRADVRAREGAPGREGARRGEPRDSLIVAVQRPDGTWLSARAPRPPGRGLRLGPLAAQTLVIYAVLLLPVLWIGRQVARPLAALTQRTAAYRIGAQPMMATEHGPEDVAALGRAIAAMQARIADDLADRDAMLGAIGHDLRTPLTSLKLRAEQMADEALRAKMTASIDRIDAMLADTLTLARSGKLGGEAVPTDLAALARGVAATARAAGQRVTLGELQALTAPAHAEALSRALLNLVANADRYAGGGTISVRQQGETAIIAVTDEGPGLPGGFEPGRAFARGDTSRNTGTGGAGLGLAIARRIAEAHGGTLTLTPRPGGGTVAAISVPMTEA